MVFGDSLSDTGRMQALYPAIPNATYYFNGRFTNGPNYIDYVQAATNASVMNYAVAGGVMCDANTAATIRAMFPSAAYGLNAQVELFVSELASMGGAAGLPGRNVALIW